jgi:iron complex transport system substrate-binding protein
MKRYVLLAAWLFASHATAVISVRDDNGNTIVLQRPAQRIVALAPHVTELVFAAGAGDHLVGTVSYSDYPPAASSIPRIGDNRQIDMERLIALKPDLLVVWLHGNAERQLEPLRKLGIPLFYSEPHKLEDIPDTLIRMGQLFGTESQAQQSATELRRKLTSLAAQYGNRPPVRVFYQVWDRPLYTLNGRHIVSDAIRLCGGENVFAKLPVTAPMVNIESVLLENPEVVITGERRDKSANGLELWKPYSALLAVRRGNLFSVDADLLNRAGPRIIAGAAALCEKLEQARSRRGDRP